MRQELAKREGVRGTFEATFVRFGSKRGYKGYPQTTLLLRDVKEAVSGKVVADHIWFTVGKRLERLPFGEGALVRFDARVTSYEKGYKGYREDVYDAPIETDYRLSFPTRIALVSKEAVPVALNLQEGINS